MIAGVFGVMALACGSGVASPAVAPESSAVPVATTGLALPDHDELDTLVGAWTSKLAPFQVTGALQKAGIAAFPALAANEVFTDKHYNYRGDFIEVRKVRFKSRHREGNPARTVRVEFLKDWDGTTWRVPSRLIIGRNREAIREHAPRMQGYPATKESDIETFLDRVLKPG